MYRVVLLEAMRVSGGHGIVVSGHDGQDFVELCEDIGWCVERVQALVGSEGRCVMPILPNTPYGNLSDLGHTCTYQVSTL